MYDKNLLHLLDYHHSMVFDKARTDAYLQAILKSINPGDVVLEIGSGTGILALFACLAGACHVYAIEQSPMIEIARKVIQQNGYGDRVTIINNWSTKTDLPEKANVLITETIGNIGFDEGILGWVIDAKKRLLQPGARIIPHQLEMVIVPVESSVDYEFIDDWLDDIYHFDFQVIKDISANILHWTRLSSKMFLSEPRSLMGVNLYEIQSDAVSGETSYVISRDGLVHGIGGWFESQLIPGLKLCTAPPNLAQSWLHGFFPLETPLNVHAGDVLEIRISTNANGAQWTWQTRLNQIKDISRKISSEGFFTTQKSIPNQPHPSA